MLRIIDMSEATSTPSFAVWDTDFDAFKSGSDGSQFWESIDEFATAFRRYPHLVVRVRALLPAAPPAPDAGPHPITKTIED